MYTDQLWVGILKDLLLDAKNVPSQKVAATLKHKAGTSGDPGCQGQVLDSPGVAQCQAKALKWMHGDGRGWKFLRCLRKDIERCLIKVKDQCFLLFTFASDNF